MTWRWRVLNHHVAAPCLSELTSTCWYSSAHHSIIAVTNSCRVYWALYIWWVFIVWYLYYEWTAYTNKVRLDAILTIDKFVVNPRSSVVWSTHWFQIKTYLWINKSKLLNDQTCVLQSSKDKLVSAVKASCLTAFILYYFTLPFCLYLCVTSLLTGIYHRIKNWSFLEPDLSNLPLEVSKLN